MNTEMMDNHKQHDEHLMTVMENMILTLGVESTFAHSNTVRVLGDGVKDALQTLVGQVPVLDMKVYTVNPKNLKEDTGVEMNVVYFTSHLLEQCERMK